MKISALLNILMQLQLRVQGPWVGSAINHTILKNVGAPHLLSNIPPLYVPFSITAQLSGETRNLSKSRKSNCELYGIFWASTQSPHRISAGGRLLFMRCVFLTLTGLVSAWRRGETPSAILAKPLSDCVTVLCLRQWKSRHLKVCEILKKKCHFQTNWISCILNWGVRCDAVNDAGYTCSCC